jgi:hypothetical protein
MRHLSRPKDKNQQFFNAGEVFLTCVSMVKNRALKDQLLSIRPQIEIEANDYDYKAENKLLYQKQPHTPAMNIDNQEMIRIYTDRMVDIKSKGRPIYDEILAAPPNQTCPLCGLGTVSSLDHYLPKSKFPVYSVTPNNLVPACNWCQIKKGEYYPQTEGKQLLHPYFDNIDNDVWLEAEVVVGIPAGFSYFASPPNHWTPAAKERVASHLEKLNLSILFSCNAGSRLAEIRGRLTKLYQNVGGYEAVREHLSEELLSIEADHKNSWTAAMYRAAIDSDWFCDGGFLET